MKFDKITKLPKFSKITELPKTPNKLLRIIF